MRRLHKDATGSLKVLIRGTKCNNKKPATCSVLPWRVQVSKTHCSSCLEGFREACGWREARKPRYCLKMAYTDILCLDFLVKLLCRICNFSCDLSLGFLPIRCLRLLDLLGTRFPLFKFFFGLLIFRYFVYVVTNLLPSNNFANDINGSSRTLVTI